jgi:phosphoribosylformylglycinamidine synthase
VHGTAKGVALACDCTPRYCEAEPVTGGRQAVAETWRNLTAVGARPLAITNCLNFGNPEKPEIMAQFAGCITGMRDACEALAFPVVSGNVSLYNETNGIAIPPTPTIGGVGLIDDLAHTTTLALKAEGEVLILIGRQDGPGWLGQSLYARQIVGVTAGAPPPVDLARERRNGDFVRALIQDGRVTTCHDIADGGLLVAVAEMAVAGNLGLALSLEGVAPATRHAWLFGEDQGRYVIACPATEAAAIVALGQHAGVAACIIGRTGGSELILYGQGAISVAGLRDAHERWLPGLMAAPTTEA